MTNNPDGLSDARALLPCPFCGRDDSDDNAVQEACVKLVGFKAPTLKQAYRVECSCGARAAAEYDPWDATRNWNHRTTPPASTSTTIAAGEVETAAISLIVDLCGAGASQSATNVRVVEDHLRQFARQIAAAPKAASEDGATGLLREVVSGFVSDLTNGGRNEPSCLSFNHDALAARIKQATAARAALHDAKEAGEQGCGEGRDG